MAVKDAKFYRRQLSLANEEEKKWRDRAKKIIDIYRDDSNQDKPTRFNILWSNTQTQFPAMYSARPKPDVRRRWKGPNKVGREIAKGIERALEFSMDSYDFDRMGEKLTLDYLLPGRMVARAKYHPLIVPRETQREVYSLEEVPEDTEYEEIEGTFIFQEKYEEKVHEEVKNYHVPWDKYRQSPADCWDDVWWVAYGDNFLTKEEIIEQFGKEHSEVPLMFTDSNEPTEEDDGEVKRAQVWELWDKEERKVVAVVEGYDEFLIEEDDPLRLNNFFPQPEPAMMIESPDSMIPIPEYTMYQFQAEELNEITRRIAKLTESMKVVGFYPGEDAAKMNQLLKSDENTLVPVDNWAAFAEKGGVKGMIDYLPIKEIADVWQRLIIQREALTQSIFELIGISDIQRGATDPRETKGAQQLKANFGSRRLLPKQQRVQRFYRDLLRINAEIIAEHFSAKTLQGMTGTEISEPMLQIMRSDALRSFTIDIETDSTVAPDDEQEKQGVAEFLGAMSNFLGQAMPIVQAAPASIEPLGKMLLWMTRKFKLARDVEEEIEQFVEAFKANPAPDAENDAKVEEAKAKLKILSEETVKKLQLDELESKREQDRKDREADAEIQRKDQLANAEIARKNATARASMNKPEAREKPSTESKVTPINRSIKLVKGEDGRTVGAQIIRDGEVENIAIER